MKLIINISEQDFHRVCQGYIDYSNTLEGRCLAAISEGVFIPDNATNGDVINAMFPEINKYFSNVIEWRLWWNAPYKKGEKE